MSGIARPAPTEAELERLFEAALPGENGAPKLTITCTVCGRHMKHIRGLIEHVLAAHPTAWTQREEVE